MNEKHCTKMVLNRLGRFSGLYYPCRRNVCSTLGRTLKFWYQVDLYHMYAWWNFHICVLQSLEENLEKLTSQRYVMEFFFARFLKWSIVVCYAKRWTPLALYTAFSDFFLCVDLRNGIHLSLACLVREIWVIFMFFDYFLENFRKFARFLGSLVTFAAS